MILTSFFTDMCRRDMAASITKHTVHYGTEVKVSSYDYFLYNILQVITGTVYAREKLILKKFGLDKLGNLLCGHKFLKKT